VDEETTNCNMFIHINFVIVCIILSFTVLLRIDLIHDVLKAENMGLIYARLNSPIPFYPPNTICSISLSVPCIKLSLFL
jgi:hypothetical protein